MPRLLSLALLALCLAGPALADEPVPTRVVSTRGVDYANPASVADLYVRLRRAARAVCPGDGPGLASQTTADRCRAEALDRALGQIDRPELYALHERQPAVRLARR